MGFLDRIFGKTKTKQKERTASKQDSEFLPSETPRRSAPIAQHNYIGTINIIGNCEQHPYIYIGSALRNVKDGDRISFDISFEPRFFDSELTSTTCRIPEFGYALLVNGVPIGSSKYNEDIYKDMQNNGYRVIITGIKNGWYAPGIIPNIDLLLPPYKELKLWWEVQKRSDQNIPYPLNSFSFGVSANENDFRPDGKLHDLYFEFIPPPSGSKAKPKILGYVDKVPLFEVTGRSSYYKLLSNFVGKTSLKGLIQRFDNEEGIPDRYRINCVDL